MKNAEVLLSDSNNFSPIVSAQPAASVQVTPIGPLSLSSVNATDEAMKDGGSDTSTPPEQPAQAKEMNLYLPHCTPRPWLLPPPPIVLAKACDQKPLVIQETGKKQPVGFNTGPTAHSSELTSSQCFELQECRTVD